jgi:uncharacterized protein YndB with AHSA1/START domain
MKDIIITRDLAYPIQLVWEAISNGNQLAQWLMTNDFQPIVGHEFTFTTDPAPGFDGIVQCKVLRIVSEQTLEISWRGGPLNTILQIDLEPIPGGTRLILRHSGFAGFNNLMPRFFLGIGWKGKTMKQLDELLASSHAKGH